MEVLMKETSRPSRENFSRKRPDTKKIHSHGPSITIPGVRGKRWNAKRGWAAWFFGREAKNRGKYWRKISKLPSLLAGDMRL